MKKRASKSESHSAKRHSWQTLIGVVTITLLLVGIVAAISKQSGQTQKPQAVQTQLPQLEERLPQVAPKNTKRHYVTRNAAGQTIVLDRQTGQTRPLTQQEQLTLAEGIKQVINQSTDGLVQVQNADGSVSMDLQGHFQNAMLARKEADGSISQSCVNDLPSAAAFFEVDPALLGIDAPASKSRPASTRLADR